MGGLFAFNLSPIACSAIGSFRIVNVIGRPCLAATSAKRSPRVSARLIDCLDAPILAAVSAAKLLASGDEPAFRPPKDTFADQDGTPAYVQARYLKR